MASWLFGISKPKTDEVILTKDTPSVPTTTQEHVNNLPTMPHLQYDLQPTRSKTSNENMNPTSMLDSIPFVLSSQINMNTDSYSYNLENTRKYLSSVKKKIMESDEFSYDFSNDRKLLSKLMSGRFKDVCQTDQVHICTGWLHCICFHTSHKDKNK